VAKGKLFDLHQFFDDRSRKSETLLSQLNLTNHATHTRTIQDYVGIGRDLLYHVFFLSHADTVGEFYSPTIKDIEDIMTNDQSHWSSNRTFQVEPTLINIPEELFLCLFEFVIEMMRRQIRQTGNVTRFGGIDVAMDEGIALAVAASR
jgi:hypothetical protein